MLLLVCVLIVPVISDNWVTKFKEKECFRCSRYDYETANFSSIMPISETEIILGAKNTIYKVEFEYNTVTPFRDEALASSESAYQNCKDTGRSEEACQNYYKVLVRITDTDLMMCGTSSFSPQCDIRHVSDLSYKSRDHVLSGDTICPSDPNTATSVIVLDSDRTVGFSATCIDECNDYQISRINLLPGSLSFNGRTMKTTDWLNSPTFVYSFEEGEYVYFLFYETAIEVRTEQVYSRVARICKNDIGSGQEYFNHFFLSYSKARIYCTSNKPGQTPFNHDEVGGAYYKDKVLYAVFSGQRNLRTGSILCSYSIKDIDAVFQGPYIVYERDQRQWVPTDNEPFSCSNKKSINVAATQTMMERAISQSSPLYYTESETRLTSVAVMDKNVQDRDYTIIYSGSEDGYVVRVGLEKGLTGTTHSSIIRAANSGHVTSLTISRDEDVIYALSDSWVSKIPTWLEDGCKFASTCNECLDLYYPYCSWCKTASEMRCVSSESECIPSNLVLPTGTCLPLPIFRDEPSDTTAARGTRVELLCSGRDGEVGSWRREDGAPITRSAAYARGSLTIPAVELNDMGYYVCTLNNTSGRVTSRASITVTEKPYFIMQPENVSAFEEDINIELQCQAAGSPKPEIKWFKQDATIPDGSEVTKPGFLRIYRVLHEDEGYYWCTATNSEGFISSRLGYLTISEGAMDNTQEESKVEAMQNVPMVGMVIAIIVSAIICFAIGLIVHQLYRKHRKKRETDMTQTPGGHVFDGRVHTRGPWTPVNTLPYQMCHAEDWRAGGGGDSGMFSSCPYPSTMLQNPPPLPLRSELLAQMPHMEGTLLEEDEAPPAYDERHSDSPPLLPPTPVSLQAPMCFPSRYTPPHFNTCPHPGYCGGHIAGPPPPTTSHYSPLNSDYAVINQSAPQPVAQQQRQYSMDLRADQRGPSNIHSRAAEGSPAQGISRAGGSRPPPPPDNAFLAGQGFNNQIV